MAAAALEKLSKGDTAGAQVFNAILAGTVEDNNAALGEELEDPLK